MDVVRFKEDDVIVASIGPQPVPGPLVFYKLANFNDGIADNATIDGLSISETVTVLKKGEAAETGIYFLANDDKTRVELENLVDHDITGIISNGDYYNDDGLWRMRKQ